MTKTRYVDEEECEYVTRQECNPVTRQQCSNVVEKVPKQSSRQVRGAGIATYNILALVCLGLQHSL